MSSKYAQPILVLQALDEVISSGYISALSRNIHRSQVSYRTYANIFNDFQSIFVQIPKQNTLYY